MNARYDAGRKAFGEGLSWAKNEFRAVLLSAEYQFSATHRSTDALVGIIGEPIKLDGRFVDEQGYAHAGALRFLRTLSDKKAVAVAIYAQRGESGTLIAYYDAIEAFPVQPNGGDIDVAWPEDKLFRL